MLIAGMIVSGIGALLCILGLIFKLAGKSPYTEQTQGKIIDMCMNAYSYNHGGSGNVSILISTGSAGAGTRCPVFEYVVNGVVYRRANPAAYNRATVNRMLNQTRTVYYDPRQPQKASLSKNSVPGILGIVFLSVGAAMVLLGFALLLLR